MSTATRLPPWLVKPLPDPVKTRKVREIVASYGLNTVCSAAKCPNQADCFSRGTATFMILGELCARDCGFCAVEHGTAGPPDTAEPHRVAAAARELHLAHVVVTSVTRDDLADGGARHFASTIAAIRKELPEARVEVLTPDFLGEADSLETVLNAEPDVFGHNIETVERLYPATRPRATYRRSLEVLRKAKAAGPRTRIKSALMLGLGEARHEIDEALMDLRAAGVEIVCIGQYLRPSLSHLPVVRFVPPEEFDEIAESARSMGFDWVSSGPFVRSSYRAALACEEAGPARLALPGPPA